jgi:hypothetical protein
MHMHMHNYIALTPTCVHVRGTTYRLKRERSTSANKHNKFASVSKALQLQPRIQFRQASDSFYPLFQQWLEFFGQKVRFTCIGFGCSSQL